jgi:dihydrofolate reductase
VKTVYFTATSLDGYIADRDNSLAWLFQFGDGGMGEHAAFMESVGAVAMGSTTYQWLLDNEIRPGTPDAKPWPYRQPSWVFTSRSLTVLPGADVRFVRGDVRPVHAEMVAAALDKNVWLVGGGDLVGQFHDHGLLDEITVSIASVTLGAGAPLLPRAITSPPLRLMKVTQEGEAFVHLTYGVATKADRWRDSDS